MRQNTTNTPTLIASTALATLYLFNCTTGTLPAIVAKVASTFLLALYGWRNTHPTIANRMGIALLLHCLGDLLIEVSPDPILHAIPAFFMAHTVYSSVLYKNTMSLSDISLPKKVCIAAFTLYAAGFTQLLMTKTSGVIQCAIPIYIAAISIMFLLACMQKQRSDGLLCAAMMYAVSDNLIGCREFLGLKAPQINDACHNFVSAVIWAGYFGGQWLAVKQQRAVHDKFPIFT